MRSHQLMGVFCEDIRGEVSGTDTVVGIFPDNISAPGLPVVFPKFALYTRINIDPAAAYAPIQIKVLGKDGSVIMSNSIEEGLILRTMEDAKNTGAPFAGIISRMLVVNFSANAEGRILAVAKIGDEEFSYASMNISSRASL